MLRLENPEESFMKYFRRVIIACFVFVHIPVYIISIYGMATLIWGYQALVESIEVPLILITILILTIIEKKCEKSHLSEDSYLPLNQKNKFGDDIAVMSGVPFHRSLTKDKDEESKTENYSITYDGDKHYDNNLAYDVELRKKALMSIVNHIKDPQRRNSIFSESDRSIHDCTFFEEEKEKYKSSQRREHKRPIRRAFSNTELKPIDEEDEFLLSEEEMSEEDYRDRRFDNGPPQIKRRMSFPMRVEELEKVENPIFSEAIDEYRQTLKQQLLDNCYADSKPPKPIVIPEPPVMADMGTQTLLRDMILDTHSEEEGEEAETEELELESDFGKNIINGVLDNISESSVKQEIHKLSPERLKEIPEFELEDILGEFDVDENGNFIFKSLNNRKVDNKERKVNQKGYLIDNKGNVINKKGEIIFYANELGDDGELPAPFVYEKHKADFLSKAMKEREGVSIEPDYMVDDDEDLVEAELLKLKPGEHESSVESLVAENPAEYMEDNLTKGKRSALISPKGEIDLDQVTRPKDGKESPNRKAITEHDVSIARSYGGKPKGAKLQNYGSPPKRIKRNDTRELFPSLAVEDQAKNKLNKIVKGMGSKEGDTSSKINKTEELRKRLARLKEEHFRDIDSEDLGELNMDLIEQRIDDFDYNRQKEYEAKMRRQIDSSMQMPYQPPMYTSSNFYPQRMPFQHSDLLPTGDNSRVGTSKANYNSRLESRGKPMSGLKKIYGNLGEIVVPAEHKDRDQPSRMHSPGSTVTLKTGFSRQPTKSKWENNGRIRGLEQIYLQKLEKRNKRPNRSSQGKRKARFRTLHNKYIDDPSILANSDPTEHNDKVSKFEG